MQRHASWKGVKNFSRGAGDPVEPIIAGNTVVGSSFCTSTVR